MEIRSQEPLVSASDNPFRPARLCAALLAAALLSACSSQSWRSSSAMWSDRNAGRAEAARTAGTAGTTGTAGAASADAGQSAATTTPAQKDSLADAGRTGGSDTAQYESAPTKGHDADTGATGGLATGESSPSGESDGKTASARRRLGRDGCKRGRPGPAGRTAGHRR
jgi:hypothetical protein